MLELPRVVPNQNNGADFFLDDWRAT